MTCKRPDSNFHLMPPNHSHFSKMAPNGSSNKKRKKDINEDNGNDEAYSIVQIKLNTLLEPHYREWILPLIEYCSYNMSRIVYEAWMLAEMHVLRLLEEGKALPKFNTSFFNSCCVNVSQTKRGGGDDELRLTMEDYRKLRPPNWPVPENEAMSQLMSSAAIEMETAFKNHITLNLVGRLKRYVRLKYNLKSSKQAYWFIVSTFRDAENMLVDDQKEFRTWLGKNPFMGVYENIPYFLGKLHEVLKWYDALDPATKGKRSFTLLPKKNGYGMSFIHLDNVALPQVLTLLEREVQCDMIQTLLTQVEPKSAEHIFLHKHVTHGFTCTFYTNKDVTRALWHLVFAVGRLETRNRTFGYRVSTNGYGASVSLKRTKRTESTKRPKAEVDYSEFTSFIGLDPGRTYVASTFDGEVSKDGKSKCIQVSTKEIHQESRVTDVKKWNLRLRKQFPGYQSMLVTLPSLKTASLAAYKDRVKQTLEHALSLFEFSRVHGFRRQRFKVARYTKKALANAAKKILNGKDPKTTIVGFGDWSQQNGLKGLEPAPVKKLRKELKKQGAKVTIVNEHRTSKSCSECCKGDCENASFVNRKGKDIKCHQVVRCLNNECSTYWQRDVNGSRNIRSVLMALVNNQERPSALRSRGSQFTKTGKSTMQ